MIGRWTIFRYCDQPLTVNPFYLQRRIGPALDKRAAALTWMRLMFTHGSMAGQYLDIMKNIRKLGFAAAMALALPASVIAHGPAIAQTPPQLAAVSAHLKAMKTMTADFAQTAQNGKTLTGKLTLARPGKIRFQYQPGVPLLVVSDGRSLSMIDYQVAQVSRWPIKSTPLGVLLDPDRDPARFARVLPEIGRASCRDSVCQYV